jgi:hypothetical protein
MTLQTLESVCFLHFDFFKFVHPLQLVQAVYWRASYCNLLRRWGKNMQNILPTFLQKVQYQDIKYISLDTEIAKHNFSTCCH